MYNCDIVESGNIYHAVLYKMQFDDGDYNLQLNGNDAKSNQSYYKFSFDRYDGISPSSRKFTVRLSPRLEINKTNIEFDVYLRHVSEQRGFKDNIQDYVPEVVSI
jgi:hypothetical protein